MTWILGLATCVLTVAFCGCASPRVGGVPLEKVKRNGIAGIEGMAAEAREVAERDYPLVAAVLEEEGGGTAFSIEFRKAIWVPYKGTAGGRAGGRDFRFGIGKR